MRGLKAALGRGCCALLLLWAWPAAGDDGEEMGFDEVEEEAPQRGAGNWSDRVHLSGRFDINFEAEDGKERFRTYHRFAFLKADLGGDMVLEAELVDQIYYEIRYALSPRLDLRAGRIWVPFGLTPFHHFYGGVQGDPFTGKLVPNVWAEQGVALSYELGGALAGDTYIIRGFSGRPGQVLSLNSGGAEGVLAYGQRLSLHLMGYKLNLAGSALYNAWGPGDDNKVLLFGADVGTDYGLVAAPLLGDLRLSAAVARANIEDPLLVDPAIDADGWYFKYGDYVQLDCGLWRPALTLRLRYGRYIDFDDVYTSEDTQSLNLALLHRRGPLLLMGEYFFNDEEVGEIDDDFLRLHAVVEF